MKVHHVIDGEAEDAIVLSNAIGTTIALWDLQVPALARRFRVIRYDNRGHGGTPVGDGVRTVADLAGDVLELLDDLGLDRVLFAGVSLGGCVGMWLAVNAPERIDRLILACTSARFGPPQGWIERAETVRESGLEAIAELSIGRWFTPRLRAGDPATVERFRELLCAVSAEGYAGCCEAIAAWRLAAELPRITAPTLVIAGADDPITPPEHGRLLADGIPRSRLEVLDDAAHLANVDQPERFTRLMSEHLDAGAHSDEERR